MYLLRWFESDKIWANGLVIDELCTYPSHWNSFQCLSDWLYEKCVPGICGIDTRELTKLIRSKGSLLGKIIVEGDNQTMGFINPNNENLVKNVSLKVISRIRYQICYKRRWLRVG